MESITRYILIGDVGLDATGKSDHKSSQLASKLKMHIIRELVGKVISSPQMHVRN